MPGIWVWFSDVRVDPIIENSCTDKLFRTATLMRSRDPGAEFSDMAGKALFVEWLVDNAPFVFNQLSSN